MAKITKAYGINYSKRIMDKSLIYLATPLGKNGRLNIETSMFCAYIDKRPNVTWNYIKTLSPEMSRNNLIEDIQSEIECTHVMLIDSDVVPPLYALSKLLEIDVDIAVGICPIYLSEGLFWNVSNKEDEWIPYHEELPSNPFEVQSAGAGCLLIKKMVLDDIGWPYFKMEYQIKHENNGSSIKMGEDVYFCRKVIVAGYKIIAHPQVKCKHFNPMELEEMYHKMKKQIETKSVKKVKA